MGGRRRGERLSAGIAGPAPPPWGIRGEADRRPHPGNPPPPQRARSLSPPALPPVNITALCSEPWRWLRTAKAGRAPRPPNRTTHSQALGCYGTSKVVFREVPDSNPATFAPIDGAKRTRWVYEWGRVRRKEKEERRKPWSPSSLQRHLRAL